MYEPRKYRELMEGGRFFSHNVIVEETDLWIGLGKSRADSKKINELEKFIINLRKEIKDYILDFPSFYKSHKPLDIHPSDSESIRQMKKAAILANTGPMASVAGLFAWKVLTYLEQFYPDEEIIVENGGDIYIKVENNIVINPFPAQNKFFSGLGLNLDANENYLSICSSSGLFGHSFSYGKADLVTVISKNACLADAWATSIANKIKTVDDVDKVCRDLPAGILAVLAIKDDRMGYKGPFKFVRT